jgi:glycosyltransferase involved in cell wall biosynthesis
MPAAAKSSAVRSQPPRPRVAVVTSEIGVRSEVWMLRQLAAFTRVDPVLFGWADAVAGMTLPDGLEVHHFKQGYTRSPSALQKAARRLGLAAGYLPSAADSRHIRSTLTDARIDAVLCHFAWNAIPVVAALDGALPTVVQVHGRDVSTLLDQPGYARALAHILPRIDHVAAVGSFQLDRLKPLGLTPRHSVIPCGAPTSLFGCNPPPVRAPGTPIRFVSVGRISPEKGFEQTLAAFEILHASHPASELVLVGAGPAEARLDLAIAHSPAGAAVRRTGYLAPGPLAELLATCHVLVQHSRQVDGWIEGFGVMLTEAGAAGLALVASRFGGIPDQVKDGINGLLFPPEDIPAQAAAMLALATDEPRRQLLGTTARAIAQGFDSNLMAARIEDRLLDSIANPVARRA